MEIPIKPKKNTRPKSVTIRLSNKMAEALRALAESHNMSQGELVEYLIQHVQTQNKKSR